MGIFQSGFFSTTKVAIGQLLYGGVVYYIDNNYFYIVKESQLPNAGNLFPCNGNWPGTSSAIGTSASNTNIIKSICPSSTVVIDCQAYSVTMDGILYDDWEVPSSGDLRAIYDNLVATNNSNFNWGTGLRTSSTQLSPITIQYFNFSGVEITSLNLSGGWRMLPVRKQLR